MATARGWRGEKAVQEQLNPVPPYSKYVAVRDFPGETPHDLPFNVGEVITVLEPCNVVFWYLGENSAGRRGVVPINFLEPCDRRKLPPSRKSQVKCSPLPFPPLKSMSAPPPRPPKSVPPPVPAKATPTQSCPRPPIAESHTPQRSHESTMPSSGSSSLPRHLSEPVTSLTSYTDIDSRPPAPLPPEATPKSKTPEPIPQTKYHSQVDFMRKSGWFSPTLETVLCKKMSAQLSAVSNFPGVYYFAHRDTRNTGYTAKSKNAFYDIVQMFHQLYDKPHDKLSVLEKELKYNLPDAKGWVIRLLTVPDVKSLDFNETWSIVNYRSLHPEGLNPKLTFHTKEHFYEFAEKYRTKKLKEKQKK